MFSNTPIHIRGFLVQAMLLLSVAATQADAAPSAELWSLWQRHQPESTKSIDHSKWTALLDTYVLDEHPSGINRVRYGSVTAADRRSLREYLERMQATSVSGLNRKEQLAYWINLYNAATVHLVLEHFPVESIRDIDLSSGFLSGLFGGGPWQAHILTVEGQKISLNDIEHRILRPIWRDNRLHYALNCASLGCPNLQTKAFTATNTERLMNDGAREYVNHPRGVSVSNGDMRLSKIYDWFQEDFGGSMSGVLAHLRKYAEPGLRKQLDQHDGGFSFHYDWALNGAAKSDRT